MKAKELTEGIIRSSWTVCPKEADGEQALDGTWVVGKWGCDSLDHMRDEIIVALDDAYQRGLKEAVEIARAKQAMLTGVGWQHLEDVIRAIKDRARDGLHRS